MKVEIWSDIVCPWCYIGKRRFEAALAQFDRGEEVEVVWRSFELDPSAPRQREGDLATHLAGKYGTTVEAARSMQEQLSATAAAEGLTFHFDQARGSNTFDAHRLLHLAAVRGVQGAVKERLMAGYFTQGQDIADHETLLRLGVEAGLDAEEARAVLAGEDYAEDVRADEAEAEALGATGVPFFVLDRRYGVSGAQPSEVLTEALQTAWAEANGLPMVSAGGGGGCCGGGCCS